MDTDQDVVLGVCSGGVQSLLEVTRFHGPRSQCIPVEFTVSPHAIAVCSAKCARKLAHKQNNCAEIMHARKPFLKYV